tara:strand:+ start:294 stop:521 length:228 start_codon:yes stop_codon:yes gene_type:complete
MDHIITFAVNKTMVHIGVVDHPGNGVSCGSGSSPFLIFSILILEVSFWDFLTFYSGNILNEFGYHTIQSACKIVW